LSPLTQILRLLYRHLRWRSPLLSGKIVLFHPQMPNHGVSIPLRLLRRQIVKLFPAPIRKRTVLSRNLPRRQGRMSKDG
ncbi:hypothetical protein PHISCL_10795, partial [Aspergillus sclerotialis]